MSGYNKQFDLSLDDMELIEGALRKHVAQQDVDCSKSPDARAVKRRVSDLLGRLHSQKRFFRPNKGGYIGG